MDPAARPGLLEVTLLLGGGEEHGWISLSGAAQGRRPVAFALGFAGDLDAVGVVDDAIEDGVGDGGFGDHPGPVLHGDLTGDQQGGPGVALLDDLEKVAAALGGEVLQSPVVEQKQGDPGEPPHEAVVCSPVAGAGEFGDEFGHAPVEHGHLLPAGLVGERTGQEGLSGSCGSDDDQVEGLADPVAGGEFGQRGACDAAAGAAVDVLEIGADAQLGMAEVSEVALVVAVPGLAFDHHGEAIVEVELVDVGDVALFLEGLDHAEEAELQQTFNIGLTEGHGVSPWLSR